MKAREFLEYLVDNLLIDEENATKYSESPNNNQTLFKTINSDKVAYLLTEFADDYDIRKKNAARITHVFMRDILNISDITDESELSGAGKLRDLYDCRVCVADITQMYVRRIMPASYETPSLLFGSEELFTIKEAENIIQNIKPLI